MKNQKLKVKKIHWYDEDSGQSSVELEYGKNKSIICFSDGCTFNKNEMAEIEEFIYLDSPDEFEEIFNNNPDHIKDIKANGEWDYEIKGQVIDVDNETIYVDCGGLILPLDDITTDPKVVGEWVKYDIERLEVVKKD